MSRIPSEYTPYNLSGITATPIPGDFRAYGSDYSEAAGHVLYIGSVPTERMVVFKAFFESIKMNLQKETEVLKKESQNFSIIKERVGELSFDVTLNVPAHSTNEAVNNLAKIAELQRLMVPGDWTRNPTTAAKRSKQFIAGASNRTNLIVPYFVVFFKNIINGGKDYVGNNPISSFEELFDLGFPCTIEQVNYTPDQDAGYFKLDHHLYPKNIKLTLTFKYESLALRPFQKREIIQSFKKNGHYAKGDTSLFPFMLKIGNSSKLTEQNEILNNADKIDFYKEDMNKIFSNEKIDSYVFISKCIPPKADNDDQGPESYLQGGASRYVLFKPIIEDFSRNLKMQIKEDDKSVNDSVYRHVADGGVSFSSFDYSLKLKVVSTSLDEAKKNAAKMQYLIRMFYKTKEDNRSYFPQKGDRAFEIPKGIRNSHLVFYIPSMIEMPSETKYEGLTTNYDTMFANGIPLFLSELNFDMPMDTGFYEEKGKIYPKEYTLDMKMISENPNAIAPYYLTGDPSSEVYTVTPFGHEELKFFDDDVAHLFPYNRQTSKIGGR
tara:strand:- start:622 stop:2268 length:1647 start_codon:yes stop_codon:yes gene_type:complete